MSATIKNLVNINNLMQGVRKGSGENETFIKAVVRFRKILKPF